MGRRNWDEILICVGIEGAGREKREHGGILRVF
jgi:hypothetical protein